MQEINSFISGFCASCLLLGFLYMLCPSGNMSATLKYTFCLCFLCCIVGMAVALPKPDFSFFDKEPETEILTEQSAATAAQSVFCEALNKQNINFRKVIVDTNKLQDGSIIISKITVYTDESAQNVINVLYSDSYEVVVINE